MATGNSLLFIPAGANMPKSTGNATPDVRNSVLVLDFDAASNESAWFPALMPRNYAGGGITCSILWMASTATSGNVKWEIALERNDTDLDADSFATGVTATGTANGTSGIATATDVALTSGAQMDSVAAGEQFRLRVTRMASDAADTMTGDAEIRGIEIRET